MGLADDLIDAEQAAALDAIKAAAHLVLEEARRDIPVGDPAVAPDPAVRLADSGGLDVHEHGVTVFFDTVYAAKIHEALNVKHPRGGSAKYLERALTTVAPRLEG